MNRKIILIAIWAALLVALSVVFYKVVANIKRKAPEAAVSVKVVTPVSPKSVKAPDGEAVISLAEGVIAGDPGSSKAEDAYWKLAAVYEKRQDLLKLKDIYQKLIEKFPSSGNISKAQDALANNNVKLLFSGIADPDSFIYDVSKGDRLVNIAKKFNTTVDLISKANALKLGILRYGRKLKITKLKFSIVVDKTQNILTLKADGNLFKTYNVSTGKDSCTPVGTFKIITKIVDPPWYPPKGKAIPSGDPKNVLGSRWLGISKPSYGIHGTIDPLSIGKSVTEGCIRMRNTEVEELYSIVPVGTEVLIVD